MNVKKALIAASIFIFALSSVTYLLNAQESHLSLNYSESNPLFIIHSRTASIKMDNDVEGTILLKGVNEAVTFYANTPKKRGGTLSIMEFVKKWGKEGKKITENPPVAALIYFSTGVENFGQRKYGEITLLIREIYYLRTHSSLELKFEILGKTDSLPDRRILEPTLFIE